MNKNKLIEMKKRLLAFGLAGVMVGTVGCSNNMDENKVPETVSISSEHSNIENYYKFAMQDGKATKFYNSKNVYMLFNKETYEVTEYIYSEPVTFFGGAELYDLESEKMLVYGDGIDTAYNVEYFKYILDNNYQVCLSDISDYVEGHTSKDYYSLDEIRNLEPEIVKGLKTINSAKVKTK